MLMTPAGLFSARDLSGLGVVRAGAFRLPESASATNMPSLPSSDMASPSWVVQKYGGTSVGKFLATIVSEIVPTYSASHRVAVVCSARSGKTKALGTTNLLLQAAHQALEEEENEPSSLSASFASLGSVPPTPNRRPSARGLEKRLAHLAGGATSSPSPSRGISRAPSQAGDSSPALVAVPAYQSTVDRILSDHIEAAQANVKDPELLAQLEQELTEDCSRLRDFLLAARVRRPR